MNTIRKPEAKHLVGLHYAYELWMAVNEANDVLLDDEDAELISFEDTITQAIAVARKDAKESEK